MKWLKERPTTRKCTTCRETHPLESFAKSNREKWGREYRCNRCTNRNRTALNIKTLYGLTLAQYFEQLESQSYRCAICKRHQVEFERPLAVDHSHTTKQNRGLLCSPCNVTIGMVNENPEVLRDIMTYLSEYNLPKNTRLA